MLLVIILIVLTNMTNNHPLSFYVDVRFGIGMTLTFFASIGFLNFYNRDQRKSSKVVDQFYDNPDVSYAPYVVGINNK